MGGNREESAEGKIIQPQSTTVNGTNGHTLAAGSQTNGRTNGYSHKTMANGPLRQSASEASHTNGITPSAAGQTNGKNPQLILQEVQTSITKIESQDKDLLVASLLQNEIKELETKFNSCQDCGSPLVYAEGCRKCINPTCGWSKCS